MNGQRALFGLPSVRMFAAAALCAALMGGLMGRAEAQAKPEG